MASAGHGRSPVSQGGTRRTFRRSCSGAALCPTEAWRQGSRPRGRPGTEDLARQASVQIQNRSSPPPFPPPPPSGGKPLRSSSLGLRTGAADQQVWHPCCRQSVPPPPPPAPEPEPRWNWVRSPAELALSPAPCLASTMPW